MTTKNRFNITKAQARKIVLKIVGPYSLDRVHGQDYDRVWSALKDRKPYYTTSSLHIIEQRYRLNNKTYHVFWKIEDSSNEQPESIEVRINRTKP